MSNIEKNYIFLRFSSLHFKFACIISNSKIKPIVHRRFARFVKPFRTEILYRLNFKRMYRGGLGMVAVFVMIGTTGMLAL